MVTLISVGGSEGQTGRCDSRCYDATESECACICDGRNHGVGLQWATDNTLALFDEWAENARKAGLTLNRGEALGQETLPLEEE